MLANCSARIAVTSRLPRRVAPQPPEACAAPGTVHPQQRSAQAAGSYHRHAFKIARLP